MKKIISAAVSSLLLIGCDERRSSDTSHLFGSVWSAFYQSESLAEKVTLDCVYFLLHGHEDMLCNVYHLATGKRADVMLLAHSSFPDDRGSYLFAVTKIGVIDLGNGSIPTLAEDFESIVGHYADTRPRPNRLLSFFVKGEDPFDPDPVLVQFLETVLK